MRTKVAEGKLLRMEFNWEIRNLERDRKRAEKEIEWRIRKLEHDAEKSAARMKEIEQRHKSFVESIDEWFREYRALVGEHNTLMREHERTHIGCERTQKGGSE